MSDANSNQEAIDQLKNLMKELVINDIVKENTNLRNELIKDVKKNTKDWMENFDKVYRQLFNDLNKPEMQD